MQDEKKTSFLKKIFGKNSSCCSLDIEEIDANEEKSSGPGDMTASCCGSTSNTAVKKDKENKK